MATRLDLNNIAVLLLNSGGAFYLHFENALQIGGHIFTETVGLDPVILHESARIPALSI